MALSGLRVVLSALAHTAPLPALSCPSLKETSRGQPLEASGAVGGPDPGYLDPYLPGDLASQRHPARSPTPTPALLARPAPPPLAALPKLSKVFSSSATSIKFPSADAGRRRKRTTTSSPLPPPSLLSSPSPLPLPRESKPCGWERAVVEPPKAPTLQGMEFVSHPPLSAPRPFPPPPPPPRSRRGPSGL